MTKRGVPVKGQLRSHKMFAKSLEKYISVVDAAKIYSTSAWNGPAEVEFFELSRLRTKTVMVSLRKTRNLTLKIIVKIACRREYSERRYSHLLVVQ